MDQVFECMFAFCEISAAEVLNEILDHLFLLIDFAVVRQLEFVEAHSHAIKVFDIADELSHVVVAGVLMITVRNVLCVVELR